MGTENDWFFKEHGHNNGNPGLERPLLSPLEALGRAGMLVLVVGTILFILYVLAAIIAR